MSILAVSRQAWFRLWTLIAGFLVGCLALASTLTALGSGSDHLWKTSSGAAKIVAAGLVFAFAVADMVGNQAMTFPRRQTSSSLVTLIGDRAGPALWGLDLALGFTTFRTSRTFWSASIVLVIVAPGFLMTATACVAYGLSFLLTVFFRRDAGYRPVSWLLKTRKRVAAVSLIAVPLLVVLGFSEGLL